MAEPDYDWIKKQLDLFIEQTALQPMHAEGVVSTLKRTAAPQNEIIEQSEVVDTILDRFYPEWRTAVPGSQRHRWAQRREAAQRCRARLARREEVASKLGDDSPRFTADTLHPWVWEPAAGPWKSGNYSDAVDAAARNISSNLRRKLQRTDIDGGDLVAQAFSLSDPAPGQPRLRIPLGDNVSEKTIRSVHGGIIDFGKGCFSVLRNPLAHESADDYSITEHEALESLTALSLLARWIERADVVTAP